MLVCRTALKGFRRTMEDKDIIELNGYGKDPTKRKINLFAIFDGHGGSKVSNFLKDEVTSHFMNLKTEYPLQKKYVNGVFDFLQNKLRNEHKDYAYTQGSTALIGAIFQKNGVRYLNVMNTGDCRCVLARDNLAIALTKDHKP